MTNSKELKTATRITGLHHITAFAGDPEANLKFYTEELGQRLVKKTVNFDDPGTYHLYYGDLAGGPGTILTFFPIKGIGRGRNGAGAVSETAYSIPTGSLGYWRDRLRYKGISLSEGERFGEALLRLTDPDGLPLALVETGNGLDVDEWAGGPIPWSKALRGFHGATALVHKYEETEKTLTGQLGYRLVAESGNRRRYETGPGGPGTYIDLKTDSNAARVRPGAGVVHHIAFATPDDKTQSAVRDALSKSGYSVSGVRDRQYFHSIYFPGPNGILFEVATNNPGFTIDEESADLGKALQLPPQYEAYRDEIEATLPDLNTRS